MNASRERIALDLGINEEHVETRMTLRESPMGQGLIDAMTIPRSDGWPIYNNFGFREVFRNRCGFHWRKLWAFCYKDSFS